MSNIVDTNIKILHSKEQNKSNAYLEYRKEWHRRPLQKDPGDFPLFLDLDASTACNFSCPSCSYTINKYQPKFMSLDLYKQIIDEAAKNNCYGVKFHTICRGEPLLNPNIVEMVRYAKSKGMIDVRMNTNGSLLNSWIIKDLVVSGLDLVIFSIDGSDKREYRKSGRTGDFSQLESNVWTFKEYSRQYGHTVVRVQAVNFDYLDIERFNNTWKSLADEVSVIDYQDMKNRTLGSKSNSWYCPMPFQRLSILYDGTILPCNQDDRLIMDLGRIGEVSIKGTWNSKEMEIIRDFNINNMAECLGLCDGCYLRTNEIIKDK